MSPGHLCSPSAEKPFYYLFFFLPIIVSWKDVYEILQASVPLPPAMVCVLALAGCSSHVCRYRAAHGEGGLVHLPEVEDAGVDVALRELPAVRAGAYVDLFPARTEAV